MRRFGLAADTLRLSVFSFLMRAVGLLYSLWLTKTIGLEALGLAQLAMVGYSFCVTLSCAGVRLASTQLCTRAEATGESPLPILRFCVLWGFGAGCLVAAGLLLLAPGIAKTALGDAGLAFALRCVAPALPFVAMTNAIYGYYTARGRILLLSCLQGAEQLFFILLVAFGLTSLPLSGIFSAPAVLMAANVGAEAFSFGLACLFLPREKKPVRTSYPIALPFLHIVAPSGVSAVLCSLLRSAQEAAVPAALVLWGLSRPDAVALYGTVNGVVYPVLFFPAAILTSLSIVIVPALTRAYTRGEQKRISSLTQRLLRLTLGFSMGCCVFLWAFAGEVAQTLFQTASYGPALALFAPLIPLAYLDLIVDSVLRSIDRQVWATLCAVLDAGVSLLLVRLLVPRFGIAGLAACVLSAKLLNLTLSLLRLESGLSLRPALLRDAALPFLLALFCATLASGVSISTLPAAASLSLRGAFFSVPYLAGLLLLWQERRKGRA